MDGVEHRCCAVPGPRNVLAERGHVFLGGNRSQLAGGSRQVVVGGAQEQAIRQRVVEDVKKLRLHRVDLLISCRDDDTRNGLRLSIPMKQCAPQRGKGLLPFSRNSIPEPQLGHDFGFH